MNIVLTTLIAAAGLIAVGSMAHLLKSMLPELASLRHAVKSGDDYRSVMVNLRDPFEQSPVEFTMPKHRRHRLLAPKPVTHRLHQFAKMRVA